MKKILVAYDGGEPAHRALDLAADLAAHYEAAVGVVSVVPFHPGRSPIDPWDDRSVHTAELAEARSLLLMRGIEPTLYEPAGEPASMIERIAEEGGYDVVVVGSRGLGPMSRFLEGSVSEHVATHAEVTVIVAR
jgi:nucleotide-binding universal stress UspA family protein